MQGNDYNKKIAPYSQTNWQTEYHTTSSAMPICQGHNNGYLQQILTKQKKKNPDLTEPLDFFLILFKTLSRSLDIRDMGFRIQLKRNPEMMNARTPILFYCSRT